MIDYIIGIKIESEKNEKKRKFFLFYSIILNLSILCFFKYLDFAISNFNNFFSLINSGYKIDLLNILLPVGISFYTFQSMSYSIDIYKRKHMAERNFLVFASYICFFPQLVAGPIERAGHLIPQLKKDLRFYDKHLLEGFVIIFWGIIKKVVIADRLSIVCDRVYSNSLSFGTMEHWIAVIFAVFMYYTDFSGYCDIAVGLSKMMGINLTKNFDRPFISKSMSEMWRRWHITMTNWFKEYVGEYLKRYTFFQKNNVFHTLSVFSLIGLWHGANWSLVCFGFFHGVALILDKFISKIFIDKKWNIFFPRKIKNTLLRGKVFFIWIFVGEFLMVRNISETPYVYKKLLSISSLPDGNLRSFIHRIGEQFSLFDFYLSCFLILVLLAVESFCENRKLKNLYIKSELLRWFLLFILITTIILIGTDIPKEYLYFQF